MMIHPLANVLSKSIGEGTNIWQYVIVLENAQIGKNCNINAHCFIENDVILGDNVTIKCGVYLWDRIRISDNVFIGPNVTFINDNYPRSKNYPTQFLQTIIETGASIGAGSVILGGLKIGKNSMIGAGSILTKDVPDNEIWFGNPARFVRKIDVNEEPVLKTTNSDQDTNDSIKLTNKQLKTVLISSAGTGAAFASILALRRNWQDSVKIVCADSNLQYLVTSSLLADKFYKVPLTTEVEFSNKLETIIEENNIQIYIPFIDDEIYLSALLFEQRFKSKSIKTQVQDSKIAETCNDKYKTFHFLREQNILTPDTYFIGEPLRSNHKLILKPRTGFGSKIIKISLNEDLASLYDSELYIVQNECDKPEITVDVCYDKNRNFFQYICRERIEVKSGVCTKTRLFYDKKVEKIALLIAQKLDLSSFCFQLMKYNGEWAVTDINARLGAGSAMGIPAGLDFFSGMFAILFGEDPSRYFRPLKNEVFITRQYSEFIMNI